MSENVLTAIIGVVGVIGAAGFGTLGVWISSVKKSIGTPNGHGDLVHMAEALLAGQAGQDKRLAQLEHGQAQHATRITQVEQTLATLAD